MKQKIVLHRNKPNKELPKSLQDTKDHNFTVYYCLKDDCSDINIKPMIMFAKTKDKRLRDISIVDISDVTKKEYTYKTFCILLNCNSNQYVVFKHHFENAIKKYLIGQLEATENDIKKYAVRGTIND